MPLNSDWRTKAEFMREVGALEATWSHDDELMSLKLAPHAPKPAAAVQAPPGPAQKMAAAFADRLKREHETRFAASHYKPRLDVTAPVNDVPRAVLAKASDGRASNKSKRR